jgi:hypothetical protein
MNSRGKNAVLCLKNVTEFSLKLELGEIKIYQDEFNIDNVLQ